MKIKAFVQKNFRLLIYGAFLLCSSFVFLGLMLWAGNSKQDGVVILQAKAITSISTRSEYIVGETVDLTGVTMQLDGGTVLTEKDFTVNADLDKAGLQAVTLTYVGEDATYQASYPVRVFSVRHLDIRQKEIRKNIDGQWDFSDLIIWAELSGAPTEFEKPDQFSALKDTAIILTNNMYSLTVTERETEGFYLATIACGNCTSSFVFNPDPDALVQDETRILSFTNVNGGEEKLTLYVTDSSNNFAIPNGADTIQVSGVYIYENANGVKTRYRFIFTLVGWASEFKSESAGEGLKDEMVGTVGSEDMQVTVNGVTFLSSDWRKPILNMG